MSKFKPGALVHMFDCPEQKKFLFYTVNALLNVLYGEPSIGPFTRGFILDNSDMFFIYFDDGDEYYQAMHVKTGICILLSAKDMTHFTELKP